MDIIMGNRLAWLWLNNDNVLVELNAGDEMVSDTPRVYTFSKTFVRRSNTFNHPPLDLLVDPPKPKVQSSHRPSPVVLS